MDDRIAHVTTDGATVVSPASDALCGWSADFVDADGFFSIDF